MMDNKTTQKETQPKVNSVWVFRASRLVSWNAGNGAVGGPWTPPIGIIKKNRPWTPHAKSAVMVEDTEAWQRMTNYLADFGDHGLCWIDSRGRSPGKITWTLRSL